MPPKKRVKGSRAEPVNSRRDSESDVSESDVMSEESDADVFSEDNIDDDDVEDDDVEDDDDDVEDDDDEDDEDDDDSKQPGDHFDAAMSAILGSRVKAHDASNPILIRNKRSAKEIEDAREDRKARQALRADKLRYKDKARIKDVIPKDPELAGDVISREKTLRKTAQRGVVKLLNAIHNAQTAALSTDAAGTDKRKAEASTEMSKEKFLDMIRMG